MIHPSPSPFVSARIAAIVVATCSAFGACDRKSTEDADESRVDDPVVAPSAGPEYFLDDATVARVVNALGDLRAAVIRKESDSPRDGSVLAIGPGIGFAVENGEKVVRLHGFTDVPEFEQALRHVQIAFSVVAATDTLGEYHRDFDGGTRRKNLEDQADALRRARTDAEHDQSLPVDLRRARAAEIDEKLEFLEQQVAELDDISDSFGPERPNVPPENVAAVRKVRDSLIALFRPITR